MRSCSWFGSDQPLSRHLTFIRRYRDEYHTQNERDRDHDPLGCFSGISKFQFHVLLTPFNVKCVREVWIGFFPQSQFHSKTPSSVCFSRLTVSNVKLYKHGFTSMKDGVQVGKILTFLVSPDKSVRTKKIKFKENKLLVRKDYEVLFKPEHLFLRRRFLLPPQVCLILQDGKPQPETIGNPTTPIPGMFPSMTYGEVSELIKREIAKARMKIKPLSLNLFIILLLLNIITIVLLLMVMKGVHF